MNDVTSFETTKKLLESGFPASQDWGLQYSLIDEKSIHSEILIREVGEGLLGNGNSKTIRASSALDILKVLGIGYGIGFDSIIEKWRCYREGYSYDWTVYNENPAEAAAEMYLKVNS